MKKWMIFALLALAGCSASKVLMIKCDHLQGDFYFCEKP